MTFEQILVAIDGGEGGLDALALAKDLAAPGASLVLVHVIVSGPHLWVGHAAAYAADSDTRSLEEFEDERAQEMLRSARDRGDVMHTGLELELRCTVAPSVGRALHELAESQTTDLLVLGSSRRGIPGRVLLGDETHAALNGAPVPVAVAPAGYREQRHRFRAIGIGYDGSPESEHAVEVGRSLAEAYGARLSALMALSVPIAGFGPGAGPLKTAIGALLRDARERIASSGLEGHAVYGSAAEELAAFSGTVDLLIVGSRGFGPVGRLVHGSTSQKLARNARCPLLILTRTSKPTPSPSAPAHDQTADGSLRLTRPLRRAFW